MACTWIPPLVEQLHGPDPTAGSDCAIACAKMAIRFATCGTLDPGMDAIRAQAGLDKPNPPPDDYSTTIEEYSRAVEAWDDEARKRGYQGVTANVHERGSWQDQLAPLIREEVKWATVFVDYGVVNDREPSKTGDKNFNGAHAVGVFGWTSADDSRTGEAQVRIFDPLCDGRASNIPKGTTWWRMSTLRDAADAYAGGGSDTVTWAATPRSKYTDPEPEPEPPVDPCADAVGAATSARTLVGAATFLLRWALEDLERANGGNPDAEGIRIRPGVKPDSA